VPSDLIERGDRRRDDLPSRFSDDFDAIITALGSGDEHDREEAVDALSELGDERVVLPLIRALDDASPYVRRAAAEALGRSSAIKAVRPLIKSLTDDDRYVREAASEALGHLGDIAIPDILSGLDDTDWRIRLGGVVALRVSSGIVPSLDPVIRRVSDDSPYVRREAVKTMGRIGDHRILPYLIEMTNDSDPGVRLRALRAVTKVGTGEEREKVLKRCMQDPDNTIRVLAAEELKHIS